MGTASDVSARELRDLLRASDKKAAGNGRRLSEGASRVLHKLETLPHAAGLHRVYFRSGEKVTLWDLFSDFQLAENGYVEVDAEAKTIARDDAVKRDRITCWRSRSRVIPELWVGEPLAR